MPTDRSRKIMDSLVLMAHDIIPVANARVIACLVNKNKIICYGVNEKKTHPMAVRFSRHPDAQSLHAEIACIRNCINKYGPDILKKSTLYVARVKRFNDNQEFIWGMAKPCRGCEDAIVTFKIPKVIYTTNTKNNLGVSYYQ